MAFRSRPARTDCTAHRTLEAWALPLLCDGASSVSIAAPNHRDDNACRGRAACGLLHRPPVRFEPDTALISNYPPLGGLRLVPQRSFADCPAPRPDRRVGAQSSSPQQESFQKPTMAAFGLPRRSCALPLLLLALLATAAPPPAAAQLLAWLAGSPLPASAPAPGTSTSISASAPKGAAAAPRRSANSSDPVLAQRIARANGTALICISPQPGQAGCSADDPTEEVTGYQVDLFRHALDVASLGFKEGGYEWRCMDW